MLKMLRTLGRPRASSRLLICNGKVNCPDSGSDLDVERCMACRLQTALDIDDRGNGFLECRFDLKSRIVDRVLH